jgi:hypothetical protein
LTYISTILPLTILSLTNSFELTDISTQNIEVQINIDLTRKVCEINEIKNLLLTKDERNKDAVFVYLDTAFFDREIFDKDLPTPFYLWYKKTFFFYNVNYWLLPTSIDWKIDKIHYNFRTCSFVKDDNKQYYEGQVIFKKVDEKWLVDTYKIKKANFKCGQTE